MQHIKKLLQENFLVCEWLVLTLVNLLDDYK